MTLKTLLGNSISVLALGLFAMPGMAADKATYKAIAKNGEIECEVTVENGNTTIKKTINGKTVKTDENDKDCDVRLQVAHELGGMLGMDVEGFSGGNKKIRMIVMDGAENGQLMSRVGDKFIFSGGKSPFLSKVGDEVTIKMIIGDDDNSVDSDAMRWFSKSGSGFGSMGFGKQLHMMGRNGSRFVIMGDDVGELDLNQDGTVTPTEARSGRNDKLKSYDSNRDGALSLDEFQTLWLADRHARMVDAFQALDEDGDAQVTGDEFAAPAVKRANRNERTMQMMKKFQAKTEKEASKNKKKKRK